MQKNYKLLYFFIIVFNFVYSIKAQSRTSYKDVLLNGKEAKLNLATGEFIFKDSNGNDSIINARRNHEDNSLERLNFHVVKAGETLLVIAEQYGLSLKKIKDANNLKTTLVSVGQKLRVRNFEEVNDKIPSNIWVVKKGNTLYHISKMSGVSISDLKRLNGLKSNNLDIGQKLYLK